MSGPSYGVIFVKFQKQLDKYVAAERKFTKLDKITEKDRKKVHKLRISVLTLYNKVLTELQLIDDKDVKKELTSGFSKKIE